ncbi:hypothetical protein N665_5364s0002, partial [Sinapis alba]
FIISHKLRSKASKQCLLIIGASSQIIREAFPTNSAWWPPGSILQVENSSVLPPGSNKEAIPLDATLRKISPFDRSAAERIFHKNVFHVPPNP